MRRKDREKDREYAYGVIDRCEYGVVAISTGEELPYCIPLSLVRVGDVLYFHCALQGRKLDLLRACPRVCATFVADTEPAYVPQVNEYTTFFSSAVVTGTAFELTGREEKIAALRALCEKLMPGDMAGFERAAETSLGATGVWGIRIETAVGKGKAREDRP